MELLVRHAACTKWTVRDGEGMPPRQIAPRSASGCGCSLPARAHTRRRFYLRLVACQESGALLEVVVDGATRRHVRGRSSCIFNFGAVSAQIPDMKETVRTPTRRTAFPPCALNSAPRSLCRSTRRWCSPAMRRSVFVLVSRCMLRASASCAHAFMHAAVKQYCAL